MTVEVNVRTPPDFARGDGAEHLLDIVDASRPWQSVLERMRALRRLPAPKPGGYSLHETIAAARPPLYASLQRSLGGTVLVAVATPDAAERAFADLLYYLRDDTDRIALLRSREEAVGAIDSPSERSARITLLSDLALARPRIVLAPVAALRQRFMPLEEFQRLRFGLRASDEIGFETLQRRLFDLGYVRSDVVSAVGEYSVRGGIIDLFAAAAEAPVRIEFFGDTIESMRTFDIESQRSNAAVDA